MKLIANNLQIEVEDSGEAGRPVVLLIMGLGMQLIAWSDALVQALQAAGFRVVRYDHRDIGLSQGFEQAGTGNLAWQGLRQRLGLPVRSAYRLQDMAEDALGVLDALGIARAHLLGASMGGMIAQRLAASAPGRVASLTSLMSSSGARGLPGPRPEVLAALLRRPRGRDEAALVAHSLGLLRLIGSPAYPEDATVMATRLRAALRRAYRPDGLRRQMLAVAADTGRAALLPRIACPTLVLHGEADPLVPLACGRDTAQRIPGARLVTIPGMGHDLPAPVERIVLGHAIPWMQAAESIRPA